MGNLAAVQSAEPLQRPKRLAARWRDRERLWRVDAELGTALYRLRRAEALDERGRELFEEAARVFEVLRRAAASEAYWDREAGGSWEDEADRSIQIIEGTRQHGGWYWDQYEPAELEAPLRELRGEPWEIVRGWDEAARRAGRERLMPMHAEEPKNYRTRLTAEAERRMSSTWHTDRAAAQIKRFTRAETCGDEATGWIVCKSCRVGALRMNYCGSPIVCSDCRRRRQGKYRAKFAHGRARLLEAIRRKRVKVGKARIRIDTGRDPMRERFLTLTMPRCGHSAAELGPLLREAGRRFISRLRAVWQRRLIERYGEEAGKELARGFTGYMRVVEVTAGTELQGHWHIHAWIVGPFVRAQVIRAMWGRALESAGLNAEAAPHAWIDKSDVITELLAAGDRVAVKSMRRFPKRLFWPRVDIRGVKSDKDPKTAKRLARELVKYLCKDWHGDTPLPAALWAELYQGMDGGRLVTSSRGLLYIERRARAGCPCCNEQAGYLFSAGGPPGAPPKPARAPPQLRLIY